MSKKEKSLKINASFDDALKGLTKSSISENQEAQTNINFIVFKMQLDALKYTLSEDQKEKYNSYIKNQIQEMQDSQRPADVKNYIVELLERSFL